MYTSDKLGWYPTWVAVEEQTDFPLHLLCWVVSCQLVSQKALEILNAPEGHPVLHASPSFSNIFLLGSYSAFQMAVSSSLFCPQVCFHSIVKICVPSFPGSFKHDPFLPLSVWTHYVAACPSPFRTSCCQLHRVTKTAFRRRSTASVVDPTVSESGNDSSSDGFSEIQNCRTEIENFKTLVFASSWSFHW